MDLIYFRRFSGHSFLFVESFRGISGGVSLQDNMSYQKDCEGVCRFLEGRAG